MPGSGQPLWKAPATGADRLAGHSDLLSQPTRARLFARLAGLGRTASTDELSEALGLHRSGVRVHLERLRAAGLVSRERLPQRLGRPRYGWHIASDALPGGQPPDAYRKLSQWLARSIPSRTARLREVERTGRELGREVVAQGGPSEPVQVMGRTLTALGFAPQSKLKRHGGVAFRLGSCPYREAVRENQAVVCALHRGLTEGILDIVKPSARLADFVAKDPDRAGCLIEVDGLLQR